ncbi:hypothetical protein NP233_g12888 [Leucocoprinus birnbaumii]|uniref:Uncharacterized protein n=1 Tax=Leucocoprinus birnbaumii TaxID=56174 RepID=A0AAD5VFM3_9AGAR|nr:hypothetical protein NP233_g12888 [Leucocoprinus birnbaumii]
MLHRNVVLDAARQELRPTRDDPNDRAIRKALDELADELYDFTMYLFVGSSMSVSFLVNAGLFFAFFKAINRD